MKFYVVKSWWLDARPYDRKWTQIRELKAKSLEEARKELKERWDCGDELRIMVDDTDEFNKNHRKQ